MFLDGLFYRQILNNFLNDNKKIIFKLYFVFLYLFFDKFSYINEFKS